MYNKNIIASFDYISCSNIPVWVRQCTECWEWAIGPAARWWWKRAASLRCTVRRRTTSLSYAPPSLTWYVQKRTIFRVKSICSYNYFLQFCAEAVSWRTKNIDILLFLLIKSLNQLSYISLKEGIMWANRKPIRLSSLV